jgi:hypothetical protein
MKSMSTGCLMITLELSQAVLKCLVCFLKLSFIKPSFKNMFGSGEASTQAFLAVWEPFLLCQLLVVLNISVTLIIWHLCICLSLGLWFPCYDKK